VPTAPWAAGPLGRLLRRVTIVVVMAVMAFGPSKLELYWTLALAVVTVTAGVLVQRRHRGELGRLDEREAARSGAGRGGH